MYRKFENLSLYLFDRFGGLVILALCLATVAIVVWAIYRTATIDRWQATVITPMETFESCHVRWIGRDGIDIETKDGRPIHVQGTAIVKWNN